MDIIITGASKGIGKFLYKEFEDRQNKVIGTCSKTFSKVLSQVNIVHFDEVSKWIDNINLGNEIVLINCAGISYNSFAHKSNLLEWNKVIEVNLLGTFNVINKLLPIMRKNNYGRIINFSSVVAQIATPGVSSYAASKSALWGLSKVLAIENATKNITINNINLGYADIGMISEVPKDYRKTIKEQIPNKKFCPPEQIYNTAEYIINNNYLNGTSIDLNGGLY